MKLLISFFAAFFLAAFSPVEDIYTIPVKSIDGKTIDLRKYRGKKILFITISPSLSDTSVSLSDLTSLQAKYPNSLIVVGVPMVEEGYKNADAIKLKSLYKDQKPNFILTEGMKVKKTSGAEQSAIFQWLTQKEKNRHYDIDIKGAGYKFFIDERGRQYAVMPSQVKLSNTIIDKILAYTLKPPVKKSE